MLWPKISLYWICQLLGWGSVALYWSYYQINNNVHIIVGLASVIIPTALAIGYTHLYRNLAHAQNWTNLSIKKLVPIMIAAWVTITTLYTSIGIINSYLIYGEVEVATFLGIFTGGTRYAAIWLLAFHLYHFSQYRAQHELLKVKGDMLHLEAQYQNLNAELNPHFLFNALNSIKALTIEDTAKSRKAVDLLSDILRNSIRISQYQKVSLSSEIERVRSYLELEQMRFEERLTYHIDIPNSLLLALLPPLSLLNLAENAVKHGIEQNPNPGLIEISANNKQNKLILTITNTGQLGKSNPSGVGIQNTKDRIAILYKNAATLDLVASDTNHVTAMLKLPLEYE